MPSLPSPRLLTAAHLALAALAAAPLALHVPTNASIVATACATVLVGALRSVKAEPPADAMTKKVGACPPQEAGSQGLPRPRHAWGGGCGRGQGAGEARGPAGWAGQGRAGQGRALIAPGPSPRAPAHPPRAPAPAPCPSPPQKRTP